jgi:hypothetical protein
MAFQCSDDLEENQVKALQKLGRLHVAYPSVDQLLRYNLNADFMFYEPRFN